MRRTTLAPAVLALVLLFLTGTSAEAAPGDARTAAVTLGDNYISGEAGRWLGNSVNNGGNRDGTDRACVPSPTGCSAYDETRAYVGRSGANGCHRSNVSELLSARLPVDERINLACSGGQNENIPRGASGGEGSKGEPPQGDQLARLAARRDVRYVILSTGSNDLGFASIVSACLTAFATSTGPCEASQQRKIDSLMPAAQAGLRKAVAEVRAIMRGARYKPWQWRFVLQSYPSVIPRASENRYPGVGPARTAIGNCPFYDSDLDWARNRAVAQISRMVEDVAAQKKVQFLDLHDAFQGREICSRTARQADAFNRPAGLTSEWGRFVDGGSISQGETQESFHPNAFGQMALGRCLTLIARRLTGSFACDNLPSLGPEGMTIRPIKAIPAPYPLKIRVRPPRARAGVRRCFSIVATSGNDRVERVRVRFRGKGVRTSGIGRARRCVRLRPGVYRARARRRGFDTARARVRIVP